LTIECRDTRKALRLFEELLPGLKRVLGPDHPETLLTRGNIALWVGKCGNARKGLRLSKALLADQKRVLGPDHPETLVTRGQIAFLTGECGTSGRRFGSWRSCFPI